MPLPVPLLIFDGDCGFCRIWIEYWKLLIGNKIAYEPYQKVASEFPGIPRERFAKSVHLALPDGRVLSGAHAVFQALAFAPGREWPLALYRRVPGFAPVTEWGYAFIAEHRPLFFRITKALFGPTVRPANYAGVERWLSKALGLIYAIAFLSLWVQIGGLIGAQGILPAEGHLSRISQVFGAGRYWNFPTVFWIGSSDLALRLACAAGAVSAILVVAGILKRTALISCYVLYLSLVSVGQEFMNFQWDILLLEAGFLAIFLGFSPVIVWMFRWLLFRLMLLSGAVKLLSGDETWRSLAALKFHYQTQPLPTPIAWYMHQLPARVQEASAVVMFAVELGTPFLIIAPRRVRSFAAYWILFLQFMILLTGNYTYFNLLTMALCIPLVGQDSAPAAPVQRAPSLRRFLAWGVAAVIFTVSAFELAAHFSVRAPSPVLRLEGLLSPLNLTSTYGLFAVMTTARYEIIVEGSNDGTSWLPYEFKYKPGDPQVAPRWVAPHQPRLDWQMWFAALGSYRDNPWFVNFVFRLLQGSPEVTALLARNPFAAAPPRYIRALVYDYSFTDWQTRRATGAWWRRAARGTYLPVVSLESFRRLSE